MFLIPITTVLLTGTAIALSATFASSAQAAPRTTSFTVHPGSVGLTDGCASIFHEAGGTKVC